MFHIISHIYLFHYSPDMSVLLSLLITKPFSDLWKTEDIQNFLIMTPRENPPRHHSPSNLCSPIHFTFKVTVDIHSHPHYFSLPHFLPLSSRPSPVSMCTIILSFLIIPSALSWMLTWLSSVTKGHYPDLSPPGINPNASPPFLVPYLIPLVLLLLRHPVDRFTMALMYCSSWNVSIPFSDA